MKIIIIVSLFFISAAYSESWVYNDETGKVYTADSINNIPERYRINAGRLPEVKKQPSIRLQVYIMPTCQYCKKLIEALNDKKIPFKAYDINSDRQAYKRFQSLGGQGVPLTLIDGNKIVRGMNIEKIEAGLK